MTAIYGERRTTSGNYGGNATQSIARMFRDGSLYNVPIELAWGAEGRIFNASVGTITTPITFGAYDADQPELSIDVPSGTTIVLLDVSFHIENSAGTDNEILLTTSTVVLGAGTSTAVTPGNLYVNNSNTSNCSVYSAYSANSATPTGVQEFWRWNNAFADTVGGRSGLDGGLRWNWRSNPPVIVQGGGAVVAYVSATTTQMDGFIKAQWAEFLTTEVLT